MPSAARKSASSRPARNASVTRTRRTSLRLNSFDPETGTFTAIAATETPVPRSDYFDGEFTEILSLQPSAVRLARLLSGRAPILDSHRAGSARDQIGVVTGARIENRQLIIEGQLSSRDDVKPIAIDMASDVIRNVSIGYRVNASTESKGRDGARVITRTDWEPIELSIVTVAADPQAHIRSAKGNSMPKRRKVVVEDELDELETRQDELRELNELEEGNDDVEPRSCSVAPLQRRVSSVQERALHQLATHNNIDASVVTDCVTRGLDVTQCRAAMVDVLAARSSAREINPGHGAGFASDPDAPNSIERAITDAIYGRMTGKAPEGRGIEFMGRSLLDMGAALLEQRGERVSWRSRDRLATQIMSRSAGLHTTSDFPVLLAAAGNRVLLDAYQAAQTPLKSIAKRRDASDFRAMSLIRLGEAPKLMEVPESGEVYYGTRAEAKEGFKVKTFARIFGLTRQAIINDDLGAFADTNAAWGRAAADTEADQLVALLTANSGNGVSLDDDDPLYATARGNKAASGTVIDVTNLGLARKALREVKGLDGTTPISVTPKHLVVGAAKETEAEQALTSLAAAQVSNANPFAGKLTLHVEPRLTGNAWRLFADPAELAVIAIAYLNGQTGPLLETRQGFDVLGTEFRCILDFGCGITEWRGTYLNPGA